MTSVLDMLKRDEGDSDHVYFNTAEGGTGIINQNIKRGSSISNGCSDAFTQPCDSLEKSLSIGYIDDVVEKGAIGSNRYKQILKLAMPAIMNNVIRQLFQLINLHFIGLLDDPAQAAAIGMGTMTANILGMSFILGFNSVLDTLISQAAGAGNFELCGVLQNRGQLFVTLLFVPIVIVLFQSETILLSLYQHKDVSAYSQQFIIAYLPSLYFQGIGDCLVRLLNNLGKTHIPFVSSAVGLIVHYFISEYFVIYLEYGINGTGLALFCTYTLMYFMMLIWAYLQADIKAAMIGPDHRTFQNLKEYGRMGIPYTIMIVLDQWVWEFMIIMAGFFTVREQTSQIILMTITSISYQFGQGLDQTACALIGNLIGAGNPTEANKFYNCLIITACGFTLSNAALLITFQDEIISLFTTDVAIVNITKDSILLVAVCTVPDSIKGMMKGAIKALGAQDTCAKINLLGHWGINLTLQLILGLYLEMHVPGQWIAKNILELYILTAYGLLIYMQDWQKVAFEVSTRLLIQEKENTLSSTDSCEQIATISGDLYFDPDNKSKLIDETK